MNFSKNVNRFFFIFEVNFTYEKIIDDDDGGTDDEWY